jgi:hypothetical protein
MVLGSICIGIGIAIAIPVGIAIGIGILNPERISMENENCWFVFPHFYWYKKLTNQERTFLF